jgi:quinolinate synthase
MTEPGIIHQMQKENPDKKFITVPGADETCNCNECPYMKLNTLQKLRDCMKNRAPEILVDESTRQKALIPINRMLQIKR